MRIAIFNKNYTKFIFLLITLLLPVIIFSPIYNKNNNININKTSSKFNGERALNDVAFQVDAGARIPGSKAHEKTIKWILDELQSNQWKTEVEHALVNGHDIKNIVGKKGNGKPWIILAAHYDSRIYANFDKDPDKLLLPVPGANDGASGVAVLLELSRIYYGDITENSWANEIWLVFFDAEDNGEIDGWTWIMGSRAFAENLNENPDVLILVDMIGDADLNIYRENNSDEKYTKEIWDVAARLGFDKYFIPENKYTIIDDHIPFIEKGIPAVDIIDFDYPYWHTTEDTTDKVSAQSLNVVGTTIYTWLTTKQNP